jgi:hypothetical protein
VAFHPAQGTVPAATVLAAAETVTLIAGRRRPYLRAGDERIAAQAARFTVSKRLYFLGPWLYDAVWRHPDSSGLSLVRQHTGLASRSACGEFITGQALQATDTTLRHPLTGTKALLWTTIATQALDTVDNEVLPRAPLAKQPALRIAIEAAHADVMAARGLVLAVAERWPQARSQWQDAADRYSATADRAPAPTHLDDLLDPRHLSPIYPRPALHHHRSGRGDTQHQWGLAAGHLPGRHRQQQVPDRAERRFGDPVMLGEHNQMVGFRPRIGPRLPPPHETARGEAMSCPTTGRPAIVIAGGR